MDILSRSDLDLDYLRASGKLYRFDASIPEHREIVTGYLENSGYALTKSGLDWLYYENKDLGLKAFFSNFPMNNWKIGRKPSLTLDFSGHYFIRSNAYLAARKLVRFFTAEFGVLFKVSRTDIRQDIYGAKEPFDYFPNFKDNSKEYRWALKGKPTFTLYNNDFSNTPTGFTIKTSRYTMMSYDRNLALEDRYRNGEITKEYYDYYKSIYGNRKVQRLEISLKQDACDFFALLFFQGDYSKEEILEMTMANFGRNHALKDYEPSKVLNKMPVNERFSELFYLNKKDDVKHFKTEFERKVGYKISDIVFTPHGRSINEVIKMLGKKIGQLSEGSEDKFSALLEDSIKLLKAKSYDFKDIISDRLDRYKAGLEFQRFDIEEMMKQSEKILNPLYGVAPP